MIKIYFHKSLHIFTRGVTKHSFEVSDYLGLSLGIQYIFPELQKHFNTDQNHNIFDGISLITKEKEIISDRKLIRNTIQKDIKELWLVPCLIGGSSDGKTNIVLGVAIAAFAIFALPAAFGAAGAGAGAGAAGPVVLSAGQAALAQGILGFGISLTLTGIIQLITPKPESPDGSDTVSRRNNDSFDALTNSATTNLPVPLNYGEIRTGGQLASGYIKTISHGKDDNIIVSELFNE